jgi:hypothetical protein
MTISIKSFLLKETLPCLRGGGSSPAEPRRGCGGWWCGPQRLAAVGAQPGGGAGGSSAAHAARLAGDAGDRGEPTQPQAAEKRLRQRPER